MLFNSLGYLVYLPIVFSIYWLLNKRLKSQNLFLLLASYFFYGLWDYRFLSLIIISSLTDYFVGLQLAKVTSYSQRRILLGISLLVNFGLLLVFKYCNYFIASFIELATIAGWQPNIATLNIILPIGISFYTFQTLSYTIDVYKRKISPTNSALNFLTYVAFFPQLVAGPIERASNLLPQIENKRSFTFLKGKEGLQQILWGFFKKVVVADNCAIFVDAIFENYETLGGLTLAIGAILFTIQIYGDFSGYSDIAIGTAKLFGIRLRQNFATPFFSRDIAEFWRRWHISLSTWFRDYLYIPLGGSRGSQWVQIRNIVAIFLLSGFWHGANTTFIFWGGLHALYFLPQFFFKTNRKHLGIVAEGQLLPGIKDLFKMLTTFFLFAFSMIIFRSPSLTESVHFLQRMAAPTNFQLPTAVTGFDRWNLLYLLIYINIMLVVEWVNRDKKYGLERLPKYNIARYLLYLIISLLVIEYFYGAQSFIYFQF